MDCKGVHYLINPTGRGVRVDGAGDGNYGASRGSRKHRGTDFYCEPGQDIESPIDGVIKRLSYPYEGDARYTGCVIEGKRLSVKLFYLNVDTTLIKRVVTAGQTIGTAQNISTRYGEPMMPHIHMQIDKIDPMYIFEMQDLIESLADKDFIGEEI